MTVTYPDKAGDDTTVKGSRPRSGVASPYYNLDSAIDVPKVIHEQAGGACTRDQLAPLLGYSGTKNGGFIARIGSARMFGLVEESGGLLRPTTLANQILSPVHSHDVQRGKVEAFRNVELFDKVYERFKGQTLPASQGLENLFRGEFKIVPAQVKTALRVFFDSADSAGFFDAAGRGRLVLPLSANTGTAPAASPAAKDQNADYDVSAVSKSREQVASRESRSSASETTIPPAIYGLIRDLPSEGTPMTGAKRERLIKAFEASINWLYPDADEETKS